MSGDGEAEGALVMSLRGQHNGPVEAYSKQRREMVVAATTMAVGYKMDDGDELVFE